MHAVAASNPFSTRFVRPGAVPFLFADGQNAESIVRRLAEHDWRGQIIGPHGCGKSTLLATLVKELERQGKKTLLIALHDGERKLPVDLQHVAEPPDLVVVDGYEQLSRYQRWRLDRLLKKRGWGLLVTAHADVGLPTLLAVSPRLETLLAVVEQLLPRDEWPFTQAEIAALFADEQNNIRETLFGLYDLYAQRRINGLDRSK